MRQQNTVETEPLRDVFAAQGILDALRSGRIYAQDILAAENGLL